MEVKLDKQIGEMAFAGKWSSLIPLLRDHADMVNTASPSKGYTPLHQAAWHGASPAVIGELLLLGADRTLTTHHQSQTAQAIAAEKHPDREDLQYLLAPCRRTLGQLMRKVASENPDWFKPYDGNQTLLDLLVALFDSVACPVRTEDLHARVEAGLLAVTGVPLPPAGSTFEFVHDFGAEHFRLSADLSWWRGHFLPTLARCLDGAHLFHIERKWCSVTDLFDPAPKQWGLRGDLFLWIEMRSALCHTAVPQDSGELAHVIGAAFTALAGRPLSEADNFSLSRFARGGMSSSFVCGEFWSRRFVAQLQQRLRWLQESWKGISKDQA